MRKDAELFGDRELSLIYVARKLKDALQLEEVMTAAGVDYAVEADHYTAGYVFKTKRVGAFFYVSPEDEARARDVLRQSGYTAHSAG